MLWDFLLFVQTLAKKHGLPLADEIEAAKPLADELLTYRHPLVYFVGESHRRMTAQTPDGPAQAMAVTKGMLTSIMEQPQAGWAAFIHTVRDVSKHMAEGGEKGKYSTERIDIFELLQMIRPVIELRGESMRRLATKLWKSKPSVTPIELWFNKPPFALTDGISAGAAANEVMLGFRQLVPISSTGMRFDIARSIWDWHEYCTYPVEREEAPGEYTRPSDGMPRDILPLSLYMGEPGAIPLPSESIAIRLSQFGMLPAAHGLQSRFGIWPSKPGMYGLKAKVAAGITLTKEEYGSYIRGNQNEIAASIELSVAANTTDAIEKSEYMIRPEGFASRTVAKKAHPEKYYYVTGEAVNVNPMGTLWYADWPINPQDTRLSRPFTSGVTAIIQGCYPGLNIG
jgi:hypothetical protein